MARREGVEHTIKVPTEGGEPPNRYMPEITVQVKVHFPPKTDHKMVADAVLQAASKVLVKLDADGGWLLLAPLGVGPG